MPLPGALGRVCTTYYRAPSTKTHPMALVDNELYPDGTVFD